MSTSTFDSLLANGITQIGDMISVAIPILLPVAIAFAALFAGLYWFKGTARRRV